MALGAHLRTLANGGLTQVACFLASTTKENRARFHEVCTTPVGGETIVHKCTLLGQVASLACVKHESVKLEHKFEQLYGGGGGGGMICLVMPGLVVELQLGFSARANT
jgi:hypothetical protein